MSIITIKLSDEHQIQGEEVWHNHRTGRACVKVEPGGQIVGEYVPKLTDDKDESILPFE